MEHAEQTVRLKELTDEASENRQISRTENSRSVCMERRAAASLMWTFEHNTVPAPAKNSQGKAQGKALSSFLQELVLLDS